MEGWAWCTLGAGRTIRCGGGLGFKGRNGTPAGAKEVEGVFMML